MAHGLPAWKGDGTLAAIPSHAKHDPLACRVFPHRQNELPMPRTPFNVKTTTLDTVQLADDENRARKSNLAVLFHTFWCFANI